MTTPFAGLESVAESAETLPLGEGRTPKRRVDTSISVEHAGHDQQYNQCERDDKQGKYGERPEVIVHPFWCVHDTSSITAVRRGGDVAAWPVSQKTVHHLGYGFADLTSFTLTTGSELQGRATHRTDIGPGRLAGKTHFVAHSEM
jgi:hypothetical protein